MVERAHLSIGEVLSLLREEFSDVTISKIRFLESQGLVDPERTPSGYRKFYENDVERLRWILRQQRENFLPLKVIRGRLSEAGDEDGEIVVAEVEVTSPPTLTYVSGTGSEPRASEARASEPRASEPRASQPRAPEPRRADPPSAPQPSAAPAPSRMPAPSLLSSPARADGRVEAGRSTAPGPEQGEDEPETFTAQELAAAARATPELVKELTQHGMIEARASVGGSAYFDRDDLAVVRIAAVFAKHGVEARHLRTWRNAATREADLFGQVVLPFLKQRNPAARQQALDTLDELSELGGQLREVLLREALRDLR